MENSSVSELQKRLEISVSLSTQKLQIIDESEDKEFLELASQLTGKRAASNGQVLGIKVVLVSFAIMFVFATGIWCI